MSKNYATVSSINNACFFRRDYSYAVNSACMGCEYCYKKADDSDERRYLSKYIDSEAEYSKDLYSAPITISRFCEPFLNDTYKKHSLAVAQKFIENGSQVIFRTAKPLDDDVKAFLNEHKDNVQLQLNCVFGTSYTEKFIREKLSPGSVDYRVILDSITDLHEDVDKVIVVDPYIIGVNDVSIRAIFVRMERQGIKKIIIKQLFSTEYFKTVLEKYIDRKFTRLLSEKVGDFYTYNNRALLVAFQSIAGEMARYPISVSFCMNRQLNDLFGWTESNCCQFKNPIGVYDRDANLMDRTKSHIIKLS